MPLQKVLACSEILVSRQLTIAFAESATAGRITAEFSLSPQSGKVLKGGIVCYDAYIKEDLLKIPHELIEKYTPESAEVTAALAKSLKNFIDADITIGITCFTTPGGSETDTKPVGTVFYTCFCT